MEQMNTIGTVHGCRSASANEGAWAAAYQRHEREIHSQEPSLRNRQRKEAQDKWRKLCLEKITDKPGQILAVQLQLSSDHFGLVRTVDSGMGPNGTTTCWYAKQIKHTERIGPKGCKSRDLTSFTKGVILTSIPWHQASLRRGVLP